MAKRIIEEPTPWGLFIIGGLVFVALLKIAIVYTLVAAFYLTALRSYPRFTLAATVAAVIFGKLFR